MANLNRIKVVLVEQQKTGKWLAEQIGELYGAMVVEAHHIIPFTESINNDTSNIIILSPNYHRIIHKTKAEFDKERLAFIFPNGLIDKVRLNKHLF